MNTRKLDKSNKKNIYCAHCANYDCDYKCALTGEKKSYWNRCKNFKWHSKYDDSEDTE